MFTVKQISKKAVHKIGDKNLEANNYVLIINTALYAEFTYFRIWNAGQLSWTSQHQHIFEILFLFEWLNYSQLLKNDFFIVIIYNIFHFPFSLTKY